MSQVETTIKCVGQTVDQLRDELWNLHMAGYGSVKPSFTVGGHDQILSIRVVKDTREGAE